MTPTLQIILFFFFNDTATTEIYTLSLHDALPISARRAAVRRHLHRPQRLPGGLTQLRRPPLPPDRQIGRATSELQSPCNLVCRLLLEKKKIHNRHTTNKQWRYMITIKRRI